MAVGDYNYGPNGYYPYGQPYYYQPVQVFQNQLGWECPKCNRVYSPSMIMCSYCGQDQVTITTTSSDGTDIR